MASKFKRCLCGLWLVVRAAPADRQGAWMVLHPVTGTHDGASGSRIPGARQPPVAAATRGMGSEQAGDEVLIEWPEIIFLDHHLAIDDHIGRIARNDVVLLLSRKVRENGVRDPEGVRPVLCIGQIGCRPEGVVDHHRHVDGVIDVLGVEAVSLPRLGR